MTTTGSQELGLDVEAVAGAYMAALAEADRHSALSVVRSALRSGAPPSVVLDEVVCAAQRTVGELWQCGRWNVAQEHAATAISEAAVELCTSAAQDDAARLPVRVLAGTVVVCCVEGEWHSLPARVVAESLRAEGWAVTYLGASVPPGHLAQFVQDSGPDAVALSCSVPSSLPRARRVLEAARAAAAPVIVGGRGFGSDERWALRLGAHAWAADGAHAVRVLRTWRPELGPAPALDDEPARASRMVGARHDALVEWAWQALVLDDPAVRAHEDQSSGVTGGRPRDDLAYLLRFLEASLLVDDHALFLESVLWAKAVRDSRHGRGHLLERSVEALQQGLLDVPLADALLAEARASLVRP